MISSRKTPVTTSNKRVILDELLGYTDKHNVTITETDLLDVYAHNIVDRSGRSAISFLSRVERVDVLKDLILVLERYLSKDGEALDLNFAKGKGIHYLASSSYEDPDLDLVDDLLDSITMTGEVRAFALLYRISPWCFDRYVPSVEECVEVAREHVERWKGVFFDHDEDRLMYWDIASSQWGVDTYRSLQSSETSIKQVIKYCKDVEYRKFLNFFASSSASVYDRESGKLKEHIDSEVGASRQPPGEVDRFLDIPFQYASVRKLLLDTNLEDIFMLTRFLESSLPEQVATFVVKNRPAMWGNQNPQAALDSYSRVLQSCKTVGGRMFWEGTLARFLDNYDRQTGLMILAEYFESACKKEITEKNINLVTSLLFDEITEVEGTDEDQFLVNNGLAFEYVLSRLREKIGSAKGVVVFLRNMYSSSLSDTPTVESWETFFDKWEDVCELPPSIGFALLGEN